MGPHTWLFFVFCLDNAQGVNHYVDQSKLRYQYSTEANSNLWTTKTTEKIETTSSATTKIPNTDMAKLGRRQNFLKARAKKMLKTVFAPEGSDKASALPQPKVLDESGNHVPLSPKHAMLRASWWVNRWYMDMLRNPYKETTVVFKSVKKRHERNYVSVCPGHVRMRFKVKSEGDFFVYLAENTPLIHETQDLLPNNLPDNTIRISVGVDSDSKIKLLVLSSQADNVVEIFQQSKYIDTLSYNSFWLWWEQCGLILMGREGEPPFLSYYINQYLDKKHGAKWNIRAIGFANPGKGDRNYDTTYVVQVEFPHGSSEVLLPGEQPHDDHDSKENMGGISQKL